MRKILSFAVSICIILTGLLVTPAQVSAAITGVEAFNTKLATFKSERYANNSTYIDDPDNTGGYQCFGFANELAVYMFGSYPTNQMAATSVNSNWTRVYGGSAVDSLCVGDVVRYLNHSIFITGISGDSIYYCQANVPSGTNKVTYDNYISRSALKTNVSKNLTLGSDLTKTGWVAHFKNGIGSVTVQQVTVTLDNQGATTSGTGSVTATYGSSMPSITVPEKTGYTFGGYYTGTGGSGTQYYTSNGTSARSWDKTSATTLYAKWTANNYSVVLSNEGATTSGTGSVTATYGSSMPSITVPKKTGYTFGGYYTGTGGSGTQYYTSSGASARTWNKTSSTTLYAYWKSNDVSTVEELQSEHPYSSNMDKTWVYTHSVESSLINVTFSSDTLFEDGYDKLYIYDGSGNQIGVYTGSELAGKTVEVPGNKVIIRLTTDSSVNKYGFRVISVTAPNYYSGTCGDNLRWTLDNGVLTINGSGAMDDYNTSVPAPWYESKSEITSVNIKNGITTIGRYAFYKCTNLTSVTIPESVTSIGRSAFTLCESLTSVTIPDRVTSIEGYTFINCASLTSVTIPESVTSIGEKAFDNCASLTSITIPDGVTSIGKNAFDNCASLTSITIPDGVTIITYGVFSNCDSLTSVTIPQSVKSINQGAFGGCNSLETVYYEGTEEQWNNIGITSYDNNYLTDAERIYLGVVHPESITLNKTADTLTVGETLTLTATVTPSNAENKAVTWSSSDETVAIVENGVVTAVGAGTATITVTTEDGGFTATCEITVEAEPEPEPEVTSPIADIATLRCYSAEWSDETKKISINVDRFPAVSKSGSVGVAIIPAEGYTVSYTFTGSNGTTSSFSNANTSKYTLLSTGVNTESSGGGALGNVPLKIFVKNNSTRMYADVVLSNGETSVTYKMTIALRDIAAEGDVDVSEILPLRADPDSFVLDNEAKTIYYETLPGVTSAGFAVKVDNGLTKATRPRRLLTAKSGYSLAHGDIKTAEKDTFDRYVVARRKVGETQTYQVKVHGGENGLSYTWYTVTVVFK